MNETTEPTVAISYFLEPGYIYLPPEPAAVSTVLGSSVAICLFDRKRQMAGINHFQFPLTREPEQATARYGNVATLTLIRLMIQNGSKPRHLSAQIVGGAHNSQHASRDVGHENVVIARKILNKKRIPIVSEDVGGQIGRKVVFKTDSGETMVIKAANLRTGDWFPYEGSR